jgi:HSP20 family protein
MRGRRRTTRRTRTGRIRDTKNEQRQEEEEETSASPRGSIGQSASRIRGEAGGRRRWGYMTPFRDSSSFGLASGDWLGGFDEIRDEMEHVFEETIENIERIPKELVREYQTAGGRMAREIGPLVYGYSYTVGADGKPQFREFGNIHPLQRSLRDGRPGARAPMLTAEREPLADVTTTDKEVKVTVEMPGISKQDIKVSVYKGGLEVSTLDKSKRKYHRTLDLPSETNIETARSTYSNGILEIIFDKQSKPRGREIKVD